MKNKLLLIFCILISLTFISAIDDFNISSTTGRLFFVNGTSGNIDIGYNISANYFIGDGSQLTGISEGIWTNSSGNATFTSGNVGIGTDSPDYKLDVDGDINLPEGNSIKFSGTNIVRVNPTSNSIAVGDTSADITKSAITVMGTNAGNGATGDVFVAQGYWAGVEAGDNFVAQGYYAGYNAGDAFAAQGYSAGYLAGNNFAAQGYYAGRQAGNNFAAQGYYAGYNAGDAFTAQGYNAGREAGDRFVAQGYYAGVEAGDNFAAQGYLAGYNAGDRFIAIGYESTRTDTLSTPADINDSIAIGYQSVPQYNGHFVLQQANINSNPLIQGNLNTGIVGIGYAVDEDLSGVGNNGLAVAGNVGIGTTTPSKKFEVNGTAGAFNIDPDNSGGPLLNTTQGNVTITSSEGSVIIQLG